MIHIKIVYKQNIKKRDNIIVWGMLMFADIRPPPLPVDIFHFRNKTQTPEGGLQTILTSRRIFIKQKKENSTSTCVHIGVCVCWEDEGEAAAEEEDSEEVVGWGAELEAEEAEAPAAPAAAAAADDELSVKLLCVMKRSRNFMAGQSVMMIFSTLEKHNERFTGK